MCHHKAPHRSWECHPNHRSLYEEDVKVPETYDDDYKNRARAAAEAKMRVDADLTYFDLGLAQPDGSTIEVGEPVRPGAWERKVPCPEDVASLRLVDRDTGEVFRFKTQSELRTFKYQRYMKRYLRPIASIDDNVGRMLEYLDAQGLANDTIVIYTSDQGFFLGDHGWFDKRFMYEESFQMPLMLRYPREVKPGVCSDVVCNVDFAATWLDFASLPIPSFMQGRSFRQLITDGPAESNAARCNWPQVAYHRYWMHQDENHNAYAHYGVRDQRHKLIYWYNEGLGLPGTSVGGQDKEWELFDCEKDPLELLNVAGEPAYREVFERMVRLLDWKMAEIGDEPVHTGCK